MSLTSSVTHDPVLTNVKLKKGLLVFSEKYKETLISEEERELEASLRKTQYIRQE